MYTVSLVMLRPAGAPPEPAGLVEPVDDGDRSLVGDAHLLRGVERRRAGGERAAELGGRLGGERDRHVLHAGAADGGGRRDHAGGRDRHRGRGRADLHGHRARDQAEAGRQRRLDAQSGSRAAGHVEADLVSGGAGARERRGRDDGVGGDLLDRQRLLRQERHEEVGRRHHGARREGSEERGRRWPCPSPRSGSGRRPAPGRASSCRRWSRRSRARGRSWPGRFRARSGRSRSTTPGRRRGASR